MDNEVGPFLRWFIYLFRLFGYCPVSLSSNSHKDWLLTLWSVLLITSLTTGMILVFVYHEYFLLTEDEFGLLNDYMKVLITIVSLNVSAWQSLTMKKHERHFWRTYIKLRVSRTPNVKEQSLYSQFCEHQRFIYKFVGIGFLNLLASLSFAFFYKDMPLKVCMFWTMFTPYLAAVFVRNVQFVLYIDLIRMEVEQLEKDLVTLGEFTEWGRPNRSFPHFDEFIRRRIVEKQQIYQDIFEMTQSFQEACNWSMVVHLLRAYIRILVDLYFCLWISMSTYNAIEDILLVPAIVEIPMFLLTAKSCTNAAKYISYRIHHLKHSPENVAASIQIQNFSLQLLHQKIKIDGLGIASMDGYMLTKAVGSITTYMFFFIQFMPKFRPASD